MEVPICHEETPKRINTVTASYNENSTDLLGNRVAGLGHRLNMDLVSKVYLVSMCTAVLIG
jgi:hypothetical protein